MEVNIRGKTVCFIWDAPRLIIRETYLREVLIFLEDSFSGGNLEDRRKRVFQRFSLAEETLASHLAGSFASFLFIFILFYLLLLLLSPSLVYNQTPLFPLTLLQFEGKEHR